MANLLDKTRDGFLGAPRAAQASTWIGLVLLALAVPRLLCSPWLAEKMGAEEPLLGNYGLLLMAQIAVFATAALGLNVQIGYAGLLNLGFAGFMAIGGYTTAILMTLEHHTPWPYWATIPIAIFHAALWGIILGYPTLRLSGDYFAIVTFGFSELVVIASRNWRSLTGGVQGIAGIPPPVLNLGFLRKEFSVLERFDYWALNVLAMALTCWAMWRLTHSRLGRSWRAIREDEVAAQACGIDIKWAKTLSFAVSAGVGGLAGSLKVILTGGCFPNDFRFIEGVTILVYVVFGGMGSILGAVLGTTILMSLLEGLRLGIDRWNELHQDGQLDPEIRWIAYGLILILVVRLRPEGLFPSRRVRAEMHPETLKMAEEMQSQ